MQEVETKTAQSVMILQMQEDVTLLSALCFPVSETFTDLQIEV